MSAPLDKVGLSSLFPTVKSLAKAGADEDFAKWARHPDHARQLVDFYRERALDNRDLVRVPDISSREMLQQLIRKMGKQFSVDKKYLEWDFLVGERGKCYEAFQWDGGSPMPCDIWNHFRFLEADGNVAAFVAWLLKHGTILKDWYLTLPSDSSKVYMDSKSGRRFFPEYARDEDGAINEDDRPYRQGEGYALCLQWEWKEMPDDGFGGTFVAFREVKNP